MQSGTRRKVLCISEWRGCKSNFRSIIIFASINFASSVRFAEINFEISKRSSTNCDASLFKDKRTLVYYWIYMYTMSTFSCITDRFCATKQWCNVSQRRIPLIILRKNCYTRTSRQFPVHFSHGIRSNPTLFNIANDLACVLRVRARWRYYSVSEEEKNTATCAFCGNCCQKFSRINSLRRWVC